MEYAPAPARSSKPDDDDDDDDDGPLLKCQKFTCTQPVGAIYEKLDPTSLNGVSLAKAATKVLSTDNSFHLHILHLPAHPTK